MQLSRIIVESVTGLAVTGGEFNAVPWIIGGIALVVVGIVAMLLMRRSRSDSNGGDGTVAGAPDREDHRGLDGDGDGGGWSADGGGSDGGGGGGD